MGPRRRDETARGAGSTGGGSGGSGGSGGPNNGVDNQLRRISSHGVEEAVVHPQAAVDADDDDAHQAVDPTPADHDIWAVAEGYTPLTDLGLGGWFDPDAGTDEQIMVSMGPSATQDNNNDDDSGNYDTHINDESGDENSGSTWHRNGGAFFVNPSAFIVSGNDTQFEDLDDEGNEEKGSELYSGPNMMGYDTIPTADFEDITARALRALDEEYINSTASSTGAKETEHRPSTELEEESRNIPDDKKDNEIIAAAFDRRKEELNRINEQHGFFVDWNLDADGHQQQQLNEHESVALPFVDTDAVRRAVKALSSRSEAPFQQKFAKWQEKQEKTKTFLQHGIIPTPFCKAFFKSTQKSKEATGNLSRSATIAEAMARLQMTAPISFSQSQPSSSPLSSISTTHHLIIDVIGVDHIECACSDTIIRTFQPLVRWLGTHLSTSSLAQSSNLYEEIHFRLIGRDLMTNITSVDLLTGVGSSISSRITKATATCINGTYHEVLENNGDFNAINAHLVIAFNGGIWGYSEWEPTIEYLAKRKESSNFVVTAYTLDESHEDYDVIERILGKDPSGCRSQVLWKPEDNPFGSRLIRETKSSTAEYRENAAWQAWRLGG